MASIWPLRGADADDRHVARLQPGLGEDEVDHHVGRRTRRGDADLLALQISHGLEVGHRLRVDAEHDHRRAALQHEGAHPLTLVLHVDGVLEGAADDVGAAAHHGLKGARAAGEVDDGEVQPFRLEKAQLLGHRQRQAVQQVLAAHGDRQLGLLDGLGPHEGGQAKQCGRAGEDELASLHFCLLGVADDSGTPPQKYRNMKTRLRPDSIAFNCSDISVAAYQSGLAGPKGSFQNNLNI